MLLVDDQPLFRRAIAALIDEQDDLVVVGEASTGLEGVERAHELHPDLVVMDVEMPVMDGVEAAKLLVEQMPGVKVVMLTVNESDEFFRGAVDAGVHGYLLKDLRPEDLYSQLRAVMRDENPLAPSLVRYLLAEVRAHHWVPRSPHSPTGDAAEVAALSHRELEVLRLVADGLSNKEIGVALTITEGTVKNHVHNALNKLGMDNRIQAAAYIVRHGLGTHRPKRAPIRQD